MITVTSRDTCRAAYIDENLIEDIKELSEIIDDRSYPFSRVHIIDPKQKHDFYLDVTESKKKIKKLIDERKELERKRAEEKESENLEQ